METSPINNTPIDLLIDSAKVLTQIGRKPSWLSNQSVAVHQGKIVDILATELAREKYTAIDHKIIDGHWLMPSFHNRHCSIGACFFHHIGLDLPNHLRLQNHLRPIETKWLNPEMVKDSCEFAINSMLKQGISSFNDHYYYPEVVAAVSKQRKIKANIGIYIDPTAKPSHIGAKAALSQGLELRDQYKHDPNINFFISIPNLNTINDELLTRIASLSNELAIPIYVNFSHLNTDINISISEYSKRPFQRLFDLGLISPLLTIGNADHLLRKELEILAKAACVITMSPMASMLQGLPMLNSSEFINLGGSIKLGTDNYNSASFDMLNSCRLMALRGKAQLGSPTSINAQQSLLSAFSYEQGLCVGQDADICSANFELEGHLINHDPTEQMVYTANHQNISHLWVKGQCLLSDSKVINNDNGPLFKSIKKWQRKIHQ